VVLFYVIAIDGKMKYGNKKGFGIKVKGRFFALNLFLKSEHSQKLWKDADKTEFLSFNHLQKGSELRRAFLIIFNVFIMQIVVTTFETTMLFAFSQRF